MSLRDLALRPIRSMPSLGGLARSSPSTLKTTTAPTQPTTFEGVGGSGPNTENPFNPWPKYGPRWKGQPTSGPTGPIPNQSNLGGTAGWNTQSPFNQNPAGSAFPQLPKSPAVVREPYNASAPVEVLPDQLLEKRVEQVRSAATPTPTFEPQKPEVLAPRAEASLAAEPAPQASTPNPPPEDLNSILLGAYTDLAKGKNPAMEQAERIALNTLGGQEKNATAEAAQRAARQGLAPGTPGYEQIMDEAQRGVQSEGSQLLSNLAQKGLDQQTANLNAASQFGYRRDVLGSQQKSDRRSAAQHIVDNPDLYTSSQVGEAKKILAEDLNIDSGSGTPWSQQEDPDPVKTKKALRDVAVARGEADPDAWANSQYLALTDAEWKGLMAAYENGDIAKAAAGGTSGGGTSWLRDLGRGAASSASGAMGSAFGIGKKIWDLL